MTVADLVRALNPGLNHPMDPATSTLALSSALIDGWRLEDPEGCLWFCATPHPAVDEGCVVPALAGVREVGAAVEAIVAHLGR